MTGAHPDDIPSTTAPDPQAPCDGLAGQVIRALLDGGKPDGHLDDCGRWAEVVAELHEAHGIGGTGAVKALWNSLTKRSADLIRLVSAGNDGPLAGTGEAVVQILMEGTAGDPPLLPPIDHARQLKELDKFVHRVMALPRRFKARNRKRAISTAVEQLLLKQDRLLLDPSEGELVGTPYVVGDDGAVWPLSDDLLAVKSMLSQAGLNAEEPAFKWLVEHLQATAFNDGPRVTLAHFWTQRDGALYVSSGPTRMVKAGVNADAVTLEMVRNGTDGVYFASDAVLPTWQPTDPLAPHEVAAFRPEIVAPPEVPGYTPEMQRLLLTAWLVALVADLRPLPILVALGDKGGGKTHLIKAVTQVTMRDNPTTLSQDSRDLETSTVWRPVLALDNVDSSPPAWLRDQLAAAVTGITKERRKLYTNRIERHLVRAGLALSTRTAAFARADVAERIVPIITGVFEDAGRKSDADLIAEVQQKRDAVLSWLTGQAVHLLQRLPHAPALPGRFVDFGRIVWVHDSSNAAAALRALQQAQALTVRDADPLIAAILEHAGDLLGERGQWTGRASALVKALRNLGATVQYEGGGKAVVRTLREGKDTLALFGLNLGSRTSGNNTVFTLRK